MFAPDKSLLLIIDVQERLFRLVKDSESTLQNIIRLVQAVHLLNIPVLLTEQVPQKLGSTRSEITAHLSGLKPIAKSTFSCAADDKFTTQLKSFQRNQIIVAGIEAHVCVYQTVRDLLDAKYEVQVVSDAVSSRSLSNKETALNRIQADGGRLTTTEMIMFELLRTSDHAKFKEIQSLIK